VRGQNPDPLRSHIARPILGTTRRIAIASDDTPLSLRLHNSPLSSLPLRHPLHARVANATVSLGAHIDANVGHSLMPIGHGRLTGQ
jgi:hypothetical protein